VIQSCFFSGRNAFGGIYGESDGSYYDNVFQANNFSGLNCPVRGTYTNTRGPFTVLSDWGMPRFIKPGARVTSLFVSVPAGTTVESVSGTTFTLSNPISGSIKTGFGFEFDGMNVSFP